MVNKKFVIGTIGSHTALQILKGAKDEGFETLIIITPKSEEFYRTFDFIDHFILLPSFDQFDSIEKALIEKNVILIPHGSFVAYLGSAKNKTLRAMYYGNKDVLDWEENRLMQRRWLIEAGINVPRQFDLKHEPITYPIIVKSFGAAGGKGYFYAKNKDDFENKMLKFEKRDYVIQEYVIGVPLYIHYFYSPLTDTLEIMSIDKRYETNVDSLGRIPLEGQQGLHIDPSYVVVGNSSLVLREGMLSEAYRMGQKTVKASKKLIGDRGIFGPFCIETIITPDIKFFTIELSCRIVAGTNLFINGSPYTWLRYNEPMSTGRRIAMEIKKAIKENKLELLLD